MALRLAYNDSSSFQELLELDNSMSVHHRNLHKLATEMYIYKNNLSPIPMQGIFNKHVITHDLRNNRCREIIESKNCPRLNRNYQISWAKNLGNATR